jgi:hypothetical protein
MKKKLIVVAFLFFTALPAKATIALVQKNANSATAVPFSATLNGTVAGNSIVVLALVNWSVVGTISVSDTVNSYSSTTERTNSVNSVQCFYVLSGVGGNITVTVSAATGTAASIWASIREYSSNGLSFDGEAGFTSSSTTSPTSNSLTTTGSNDLLVGAMIDFNAISGGITGSWGNEGKNTNQSTVVCETEDQRNVAAGSYQSQFTLASAQSDWAANIVAFKESGGAAAPAGMNKRQKLELLDPQRRKR